MESSSEVKKFNYFENEAMNRKKELNEKSEKHLSNNLNNILQDLNAILLREIKRQQQPRQFYLFEKKEVIETKIQRLKKIQQDLIVEFNNFNTWYGENEESLEAKDIEEKQNLIKKELTLRVEKVRDKIGDYLNTDGNKQANRFWAFIDKYLGEVFFMTTGGREILGPKITEKLGDCGIQFYAQHTDKRENTYLSTQVKSEESSLSNIRKKS